MEISAKVITAVIAAFAVNIVMTWVLVSYNSREIVSFNMKETIDTFSRQVIAQKNSDENVKRLTERFNAALNKSIADYAEKNNAIVLVRPAVVEGARDITAELQNDIAIQMQGHGK